jgi:hypothetical protein
MHYTYGMSDENLATMTPAEIDTRLAGIWHRHDQMAMYERQAQLRLRNEKRRALQRRHDATCQARIDEAQADIERYAAAAAAVLAEAEPFNAEYQRRGRWNRYYQVNTSSNGHVHNTRSCKTCYPTTGFRWLVQLADQPESAMVESYGHVACTVCFPSAPVLEAAPTPGRCPSTGIQKISDGLGACRDCGRHARITTRGRLRAHDPKSA